jgi:hypothetical protein
MGQAKRPGQTLAPFERGVGGGEGHQGEREGKAKVKAETQTQKVFRIMAGLNEEDQNSVAITTLAANFLQHGEGDFEAWLAAVVVGIRALHDLMLAEAWSIDAELAGGLQ